MKKLERGEIKLHDFYVAFGEQLSDPINKEHYRAYMTKQGRGNVQYIVAANEF